GFVDAHTHVELTAYSTFLWETVSGLKRSEILARLASLVTVKPAGEWIVLQGTFGQDLPQLDELDAVAPQHPVAVRWTMHKYQVNSLAMQVSGIDHGGVAGTGVRIARDAHGAPTGLIEEGWDLLRAPVMDGERLESAL